MRRKPKRGRGQRKVPFATKFDVAHRSLEWRAVFDRLLVARKAEIWLEWEGKWVVMYVRLRDGELVPVRRYSHKTSMQIVQSDPDTTEFMVAMKKLMDPHGACLGVGHEGDEAVIQYVFPEASTVECVTIAWCGKGKRVRYLRDEEDHATATP